MNEGKATQETYRLAGRTFLRKMNRKCDIRANDHVSMVRVLTDHPTGRFG